MPGKTFTAPKVWKRPYTSIYSDNYRYGNSLYSGAVADIENRTRGYAPNYNENYGSSSASIISDPGVRRAILEAELLTSSDIMQPSSVSMINADSSSSAALHRSSSSRNYQLETTTTTITSTRPANESYSAYASAKDLANVESELEESRARRRRERTGRSLVRPETMYHVSSYDLVDPLMTTSHQAPVMSAESHLKDWSLERWYEKAVRNAHRPAAFPTR